ncbi:MAG: DUF6677 family protein [Planctomycetota bacterium]
MPLDEPTAPDAARPSQSSDPPAPAEEAEQAEPGGAASHAEPFDRRRGFVPVAGVLALLMPGLGHLYLGLRPRGARIAGGVLGLFALGLVVGGLDVVDADQDPWWYAGQAAVGPPAWAANYAHQTWYKYPARDMPNGRRKPEPGEVVTSTGQIEFGGDTAEPPAMTKSVGRVNEIGSLACALAGMMNLIAIIDAAFPPLRRRREGARL